MSSENNLTINKIIKLGWAALVVSASLLVISIYLVKFYHSDIVTYSIWLTFARIFGIISFFIGVFSIAVGKWNQGTLLILGSVLLPILSLYIHQSI
ncbi:MAG: hypothetical protein KDD56_08485 [Bdellovibrionales bacterium]|nr:hypothetical protein [Bdellovibrionales bacterium]